jgi:hypothetical protein
VKIYNPADFVEIELSDDTTQWRKEAREEGVREGKIREVIPDEMAPEEERLINAYADLYESVWRGRSGIHLRCGLKVMMGPWI